MKSDDAKMLGSEATALKRLRAAGARDYSFTGEVRTHYRDGFTDGWEAAKRDSVNRARLRLTARLGRMPDRQKE